MRTPRLLLIAACAGLPAAALAQTTTGSSITYSLSGVEAPGGNGNGILDPGESLLLTINASFTNQNTVASFSPGIGTFGAGTIRGFAAGILDINLTGGGSGGTWNVDPNGTPSHGVATAWDLAHREGTPANGGNNLRDIEFGQFPPSVGAINTANPINAIWTGLWTPASYAVRSMTFTLAPNAQAGPLSALDFELSPTATGAVYANAQYGSFSYNIAPAPATLPLLGVATLWARRRRSR